VVDAQRHIAVNDYLRREPIGHLFGSRSDISWGPDTVVSPDIIVVPLEEARTLEWAKMQHLLLVAEVLSPSSTRHCESGARPAPRH
jgi:Uma2 family endonuclease